MRKHSFAGLSTTTPRRPGNLARLPTYRLLTETGDNLGPFRTGTTEWEAGDKIFRGFDTLEVVNVTPAEPGDDFDGYLIVSPAA